MNFFNTIIIGGGAAGLFCGMFLNKGKNCILEKKSNPGKKLSITGSGQCNLTSIEDISFFFDKYGNNGKFLKSAFYKFSNNDLVDLLNNNGVKTTVVKNKIFPASLNAKEIVGFFRKGCKKAGTDIFIDKEVISMEKSENHFSLKTKDGDLYKCENLIISTGGASYPETGSDGSFFEILQQMQVDITPLNPSCVPFYVKNYKFKDFAGVAFEDCILSLWSENNKKLKETRGAFLFTHQGISGPAVFTLSRYANPGNIVKINFVNMPVDQFKNQLESKLLSANKKLVKTILLEFNIPNRLINRLLEITGLDVNVKASVLKKENKKELIKNLCELRLDIQELGNITIAVATAGGVNLKDINPTTMEHRKIKNMYFCGEVIDIDGDTGGYNLQAAFSTAFLASNTINKKTLD